MAWEQFFLEHPPISIVLVRLAMFGGKRSLSFEQQNGFFFNWEARTTAICSIVLKHDVYRALCRLFLFADRTLRIDYKVIYQSILNGIRYIRNVHTKCTCDLHFPLVRSWVRSAERMAVGYLLDSNGRKGSASPAADEFQFNRPFKGRRKAVEKRWAVSS